MNCAPLISAFHTLVGCTCGWRPLPVSRELSYVEAPFASGKYPMIPRAGFAAPVDDQWAVHAAIRRTILARSPLMREGVTEEAWDLWFAAWLVRANDAVAALELRFGTLA